jgi:hypothetical protein
MVNTVSLWIFSGERSGRDTLNAFFMPPTQHDDTIGATHDHTPENQSFHRFFFPTLLFITKIQKK